ncbi:MAG: hypothetical protein WBB43_25810 [Limnoraphis sp.]
MKTSLVEFNRLDTLIITVGTRQVGWKCEDGVVRCLGADGDRGHPPHINQLYQELGIERQFHEPGQSQTLWSVRDLGYRLLEYCQEWLDKDFSNVQLLLDGHIINDGVKKGLKHIILWATDQPEKTPWVYRRADTIALAELMQGKILADYPHLQVDIVHPIVSANDRETIRQELEGFILPLALETASNFDEEFVLGIENKGAVPAIAESLEICAAALVRQCQVFSITPVEPHPLYDEPSPHQKSSRSAETYQWVAVSEYFWPLERSRVIYAWERGDFSEAKLWLKSHQNRYRFLYQLAGYLSISNNWEIADFIKNKEFENSWLRSNAVSQQAGSKQVEEWRTHLKELRENKHLEVWESVFFINLLLNQENYTAAFYQFSQTLERLLYVRCQSENWLNKGYVDLGDYRGSPETYNPGFKKLIDGWFKAKNQSQDSVYKLFDHIRELRNKIVHKAVSISQKDLILLWKNAGWQLEIIDSPEAAIKTRFVETMLMVCPSNWQISEQSLVESLYNWGLTVLKSDSALN